MRKKLAGIIINGKRFFPPAVPASLAPSLQSHRCGPLTLFGELLEGNQLFHRQRAVMRARRTTAKRA